MNKTSVSLLQRLQHGTDPDSWKMLVEIYQPLIHAWLRAQGTPAQDVDDLTQEVLTVLVRELPRFKHSGRVGAFRTWLRGVVANRLRTYWRDRGQATTRDAQLLSEQLDDPGSEPNQLWDQQHDEHLLSWLLEVARTQFEPTTYAAFRRVALEGASPAEVAAELNLSITAVYIAKSRVLSRLRTEAEGLLD